MDNNIISCSLIDKRDGNDVEKAAQELCDVLNAFAYATGLHKRGFFSEKNAKFHLKRNSASNYSIRSNMQTAYSGSKEELSVTVHEYGYELWTTCETEGFGFHNKDAVPNIVEIVASEAIQTGWQMADLQKDLLGFPPIVSAASPREALFGKRGSSKQPPFSEPV